VERALVLINWEGFDVLIKIFQTALLDRSFLVSMLMTVRKQFRFVLKLIYFLRFFLNVLFPYLFNLFFFDFNSKK